jgi:ActR/RegA family two-component response regulator
MAAKEDGKPAVRADELDARAGVAIAAPEADAPDATVDMTRGIDARGQKPAPLPDPAVIEEALRTHGGNVSAAARALGLHRNQIRRFLARKDDDDAAD